MTDTLAVWLMGVLDTLDLVSGWSGYHYMSVISMGACFIWYLTLARFAKQLEKSDKQDWIVLEDVIHH